jgi:hypothetical protein
MAPGAINLDFAAQSEVYRHYVDGFRNADGQLPQMMQLKLEHTFFVVANAKAIAAGEGFTAIERELALIAALMHDVGRYEQVKRYDTFRDADSIDHARLSYDIIREKGWIKEKAVLDAVLFHNRRDLPCGMDGLTSVAAKTVRDADKLDIFRVLEAQVAQSDWQGGSKAFWGLPVSQPPNPRLVDCILSSRPVDYREIKSLADFVLIQVGWMVSELEYATSRRLCRERGHLAFRRQFLHQITDDASVDKVCDLAQKTLCN